MPDLPLITKYCTVLYSVHWLLRNRLLANLFLVFLVQLLIGIAIHLAKFMIVFSVLLKNDDSHFKRSSDKRTKTFVNDERK